MRFLLIPLLLVATNIAVNAADALDFVTDVSPILNKYCVGCHNADDNEGGLRLDDHAAILVGGDTGLAVTAGAAGSSRMLLMTMGKIEPKMPPDDEPGPSVDEIETIAAWIDQGAVGPDGDMPIKTSLRTPQIEPDKDSPRPVTSIAVSADGNVRAIARFSAVQIMRADGTTISEIRELPGKVNSLAFSRDAKRILVASGLTGAFGRAAIYRVDDAGMESEMLGHRDVLYSAVFSADEKWVATAGYDRVIKVWDRNTATVVHELNGHNGAIYDLAFSHDSKVLASASADATIKVGMSKRVNASIPSARARARCWRLTLPPTANSLSAAVRIIDCEFGDSKVSIRPQLIRSSSRGLSTSRRWSVSRSQLIRIIWQCLANRET